MTPLIELAWTQLWQVTAVAAAVALLVKMGCRHRPHLAHALWLVVLVKCLTPPLWSSPTSIFSWAAREPGTPFTIASAVSPADTSIGLTPVSHSLRGARHESPGGEQLLPSKYAHSIPIT